MDCIEKKTNPAEANKGSFNYLNMNDTAPADQCKDDVDGVIKVDKISFTKRCRQYLKQPAILLCASHLFSYWGDRMWGFAVGLYLVEMTPNSLRLTAIFGLVSTLSVVVFGPAVGDWVDVTPRLRAVKLSLVTQNILVSLCAIMVLLHLMVHTPHKERAVYITLEAAIIILGAMASLVGRGTTIAVERDWVVVITDGDQEGLAGLNTKLRRIDLTCAVLGPAAVGFIMSLVSKYAGIILICSWNISSFFIEYYLLLHVYKAVPALASKELKIKNVIPEHAGASLENNENDGVDGELGIKIKHGGGCSFFNVWERICSFLKGWSVYAKQTIALAGTSLAMLYLTFLGFSSITTGYVYTQRLSEGVISACYAIASLFGILGTVLFSVVRRWVGLPRTGLVSFFLQLAMLSLCVVSIWLPGSPFLSKYSHNSGISNVNRKTTFLFPSPTQSASSTKPFSLQNSKASERSFTPVYSTSLRTNASSQLLASILSISRNAKRTPFTPGAPLSTNADVTLKGSASVSTTSPFCSSCQLKNNNSGTREQEADTFSYWSVGVLVTGLVLSRAGLWMTDLTVTQLMQENVIETERGIVSGTQQAFNSVLDLLHYVLTICLPKPGQFWILILISYGAIFIGYIIYILFYIRFSRQRVQSQNQHVVSGSWEHLIIDEL